MGRLFTLVLVAAVLTWMYRIWRERRGDDGTGAAAPPRGGAVFRVLYRGGERVACDGRIPRGTLSAFDDIAAHARLDGQVSLSRSGELQFSEQVPPGTRQQMRNAWMTSVNVH